jgi:hypothetical protein
VADSFAALNRLLGLGVVAALTIRIRLIGGGSVQKRKENGIGTQRVERVQERTAPFRRNPVDQLVELLLSASITPYTCT